MSLNLVLMQIYKLLLLLLLLKSVEFDDDVALLLSVAGLVTASANKIIIDNVQPNAGNTDKE